MVLWHVDMILTYNIEEVPYAGVLRVQPGGAAAVPAGVRGAQGAPAERGRAGARAGFERRRRTARRNSTTSGSIIVCTF